MPIINLKDYLQHNEQELQEIMRNLEARIEKSPKESLQISSSNGRTTYYVTNRDGSRTYLSKKEKNLINAMAQKQYDLKLHKIASKQLCDLQRFLSRYQPTELQELYENMHPERKVLIQDHILSDEEYAVKWQSEVYCPKGFVKGDAEIITERGERVRSKTEKIIADKLYDMGIPYKYEASLDLKGYGIVYPDFKVLKVSKRKELYWEHFGMMDDQNYVEKVLKKINSYEKSNYFPGDKLIITYESKAMPLRKQTIEEIIKQFLL